MVCDPTAKDTNLEDTCISISKQPISWLSEDIKLNGQLFNGTSTGLPDDQAIFIQDNKVDVRVRRVNNQGCELPSDGEGGTSRIKIDVYVAVPGPNLKPNLKGPNGERLVIQIGTKFMTTSGDQPNLSVGGIKSLSEIGQTITWRPASNNDQDADGKGPNANSHRCLIVRCYPELGPSPDPNCFHTIGDPHVTQHNIDIVSGRGRLRALVWTSNFNDEEFEPATLRLVAELNPEPRLIEILTPALEATPGYQRIVRTAPVSFGLELPDFPDAKVRDNTRLGCLGKILKALGLLKNSAFEPKYEADIQLQPSQVTSFNFTVDLSGSNSGDAHIIHLMHVRSDQQVIGGLTLVAVAV